MSSFCSSDLTKLEKAFEASRLPCKRRILSGGWGANR